MIIFAENKTLPISGIYKERIYNGNGCYHWKKEKALVLVKLLKLIKNT